MSQVVTRFEDLIAWQKARVLTGEIYKLTQQPPFTRDFALSNQMQRSAVSVMANIAEGFERNRPGEFYQFLTIAKASCAELRSHLYISLDIAYLSPEQFQILIRQCEELGRIISGLRTRVGEKK